MGKKPGKEFSKKSKGKGISDEAIMLLYDNISSITLYGGIEAFEDMLM